MDVPVPFCAPVIDAFGIIAQLNKVLGTDPVKVINAAVFEQMLCEVGFTLTSGIGLILIFSECELVHPVAFTVSIRV